MRSAAALRAADWLASVGVVALVVTVYAPPGRWKDGAAVLTLLCIVAAYGALLASRPPVEDLCHERTPDDSPGPCTHAVCHRTGPHTTHKAWSNDGTLLHWEE